MNPGNFSATSPSASSSVHMRASHPGCNSTQLLLASVHVSRALAGPSMMWCRIGGTRSGCSGPAEVSWTPYSAKVTSKLSAAREMTKSDEFRDQPMGRRRSVHAV